MADIKFSGNTKLRTINAEFIKSFPYLFLSFVDASDKWVKDQDTTHAKVRAAGKTGGELSINGNMLVSTFEKRYLEAFGSKVLVKYEMNGKGYHVVKKAEKYAMTFSALNKWLSENGASYIPKVYPGYAQGNWDKAE